jgi:acyl-CoA thioesterase I
MTNHWPAAVALLLVLPTIGRAQPAQPPCTFPQEIIDMGNPVHRTSWPASTDVPLKIVALGSSSTAGAGASKPEASYPTRFREQLSFLLSRQAIVRNRGRNGDRVGDMLVRLRTEVIPQRPHAVIWQLGTNALLTAFSGDDFRLLFL